MGRYECVCITVNYACSQNFPSAHVGGGRAAKLSFCYHCQHKQKNKRRPGNKAVMMRPGIGRNASCAVGDFA